MLQENYVNILKEELRVLLKTRSNWGAGEQINSSPYVIHRQPPRKPKSTFILRTGFSNEEKEEKEFVVIHLKKYFVLLFPPYAKNLQRAWKLCSPQMVCSFSFPPPLEVKLYHHVFILCQFLTFLCCFSFYTRVIIFSAFTYAKSTSR